MTHEQDSATSPSRPPFSHDCISLDALSGRQQRLIERHLPLVDLTLRRHLNHRLTFHQKSDLHQEGCMTLARCLRNHQPMRHGHFAPYAIARIRFAIFKSLHEDRLVRVPYSTHRRHRSKLTRSRSRDSP